MNWFKTAQADFADRNILNDKIDDLKLISVTLEKIAKLVFQTQAGSKDVIQQVLDTKRLSNFPEIEKMIVEASNICMDSPQRVALLCKSAIAELVLRVSKLERERKIMTNKTIPNRWKGWREND